MPTSLTRNEDVGDIQVKSLYLSSLNILIQYFYYYSFKINTILHKLGSLHELSFSSPRKHTYKFDNNEWCPTEINDYEEDGINISVFTTHVIPVIKC